MFDLELVQCWNCFYEDLAETELLESGLHKECPRCGKEMLTESEMYAHQESLAGQADDAFDWLAHRQPSQTTLLSNNKEKLHHGT